jgi:hypothetical protein
MKEKTLYLALIAASTSLSGCAAVRGIFKAGVWSGVIMAVVIALVIMGVMAFFNRPRT